MMAGPDTPEGEELDVMVTLIEAYEASASQF
jgi:HTH-type transcriptional regulator/antitoxin HigA